ncbi:MAG TPA: hypothetical protein VNU26_00295 [Mycobacteriales bacterium]|nr:hypothetical protein [Mycobacteriales bacterium]
MPVSRKAPALPTLPESANAAVTPAQWRDDAGRLQPEARDRRQEERLRASGDEREPDEHEHDEEPGDRGGHRVAAAQPLDEHDTAGYGTRRGTDDQPADGVARHVGDRRQRGEQRAAGAAEEVDGPSQRRDGHGLRACAHDSCRFRCTTSPLAPAAPSRRRPPGS